MSRIGNLPIKIPQGVSIDISADNIVTVKGKLGQLTQFIHPSIKINIDGDTLTLTRSNDEKQTRMYHGLYRSLLNNMVTGVSEGFTKTLELVGVGYKAQAQGQILELALGFSHSVLFELPPEISVTTVTERGSNPKIILKSFDKQLLGQVAAKIRSLRKPEPYKGKGVKYEGEYIRRKAGKAAASVK
ncbi:MAG TPA: 50S ribosomal protein L6 [Bacteroidales bacterium]|nr:50S ribosomal protein L6 [Bacteroidales bacterium]